MKPDIGNSAHLEQLLSSFSRVYSTVGVYVGFKSRTIPKESESWVCFLVFLSDRGREPKEGHPVNVKRCVPSTASLKLSCQSAEEQTAMDWRLDEWREGGQHHKPPSSAIFKNKLFLYLYNFLHISFFFFKQGVIEWQLYVFLSFGFLLICQHKNRKEN